MSVIANNIVAGAAGQGGAEAYQIDRSLRFDSSASSYLSRTPSSAGNRKTWTWSGWVKRSKIDSSTSVYGLFGAYDIQTNHAYIIFYQDGIRISDRPPAGQNALLQTTQVFRDPSAWYHIVVAWDGSNSTSSDRVRLYVNGSRVTSFSTATYPTTSNSVFNSAIEHSLGRDVSNNGYFNGYLADVHFIDGQALDPTDFGEYDDNNVWQPKDTSGLTFGTNGFHLDFSDNSSNAALGYDAAGSNDWTVNNLVADAPATAKGGFDVVTYSGNSSTQNITGLNFQPDLVWIKARNDTSYHFLTDSVRGVNKHLASNATDQEGNVTAVTAFNSDGFSLANQANVNASPFNYVAWCWKAGGTAVSNTDGTITSQVSANTDYGFSIVTYAGNSTDNATFGHGLGVAPAMVIVKNRTSAANGLAGSHWLTRHQAIGMTGSGTSCQLFLNLTNGVLNNDHGTLITSGNNLLQIKASGGSIPYFHVGESGQNYVAYCWSEVPGFSKFGSWQHNNTNTGPKITTGFKPRFLLIKNSDNAEQWYIFDTVRMPTNSQSGANNTNLRPNSTGAEGSYTMSATVNFLDDGFQVVTTTPDELAFGTRNYIYAAFAEQPPGSVIDSLIDTPTNADTPTDTGAGNEVVGNYCTWNPNASSSSMILSNGNLESMNTGSWVAALGSIGVKGGKWYWEMTLKDSTNHMYGIAYDQPNLGGHNTTVYGYYSFTGQSFALGAQGASYGSSSAAGDVIGVALDLSAGGTNGTLTFYKNNTSMGTAFSNIDCSKTYFPWVLEHNNTAGSVANFGQRGFAYTAPSGFKAINTASLPDPTIADGSTAMDALLFTGNGGSQTLSGLKFSPDFTWFKTRLVPFSHELLDIVRGGTKVSFSDLTNQESTNGSLVTSFNSDGVSIGSALGANGSTRPSVLWAWDAGTSTVTNNNGSIESTVRANPSAGFSIVTFNTGSSGAKSVGHGLNAEPHLIITKCRTAAFAWRTYHKSATTIDQTLELNSTGAVATSAGHWGSAAPTSSVFGITSGQAQPANEDCVAYCFAPVEGYSSFGSFASGSSPFVYLGFRPKYILTKGLGSGRIWNIYDTSRDPYNAAGKILKAENAGSEIDSPPRIDFLSNGFKVRASSGAEPNVSDTYIFACFAESPFKIARAR